MTEFTAATCRRYCLTTRNHSHPIWHITCIVYHRCSLLIVQDDSTNRRYSRSSIRILRIFRPTTSGSTRIITDITGASSLTPSNGLLTAVIRGRELHVMSAASADIRSPYLFRARPASFVPHVMRRRRSSGSRISATISFCLCLTVSGRSLSRRDSGLISCTTGDFCLSWSMRLISL